MSARPRDATRAASRRKSREAPRKRAAVSVEPVVEADPLQLLADQAPPWWMLALEGRAVFEWGAWLLARPWFQHAPRGAPHPVLVLPGLLASDRSTWPLRRFLEQLGYHAYAWEEGANRGPQPGLQERLQDRIAALADRHGEQVTLLGWSLGGLMARALAWHQPEPVRAVITMGSPLSAQPSHTNVAKVFQWATGLDPTDPAVRTMIGGHPPVPLTSILSKTDGVVHWKASLAPRGDRCESIEVPASHLGLGVNPLVLWVVADRLAQVPHSWQPFEHAGWRRVLYRNPHLENLFGG